MASSSPYFLDTCVPIYAVGKEHPYREPCARIVMAAAKGEIDVVIDAEVIQEIAYHFHAIKRRAAGLRLAESFLQIVDTVLPVRREEAARSLDLQHTHSSLSPRDAIHLAVMEAAGLTRIVTVDRHFDRVPGIERVDPGDLRW